jgi:uncharacterized repeat protein (TIGR02543 family)
MNGSGSAQPVPPTQTVAQGETATKPATDPARNNYVFSGWYKDADATMPWDFATDVVNANTTIYAKWSEPGKATYTVTFSTGGSSVPAQTVSQGAKATQPASPVRAGYVFEGWTTYEQTPWDFNTDVVNGNITIYAKWSQETSSFAIKQQLPLGKISAIKNGLAINAAGGVSITVFNLSGNAVRKHNFAQGNYALKFDDLPKGMYIVKASFGNGAAPRILSLPVR